VILDSSPLNIEKASKLLCAGGVVAFPTETVYGLGADATNEDAVRKIFEIKKRPSYDPLIVHFYSPEQILEFVDLSNSIVQNNFQKLKAFWPGPLSLVLPLKSGIAPSVTSGLFTVAVRIPRHAVALALLKAVNIPLAAPSANQFSYVSPTTALHVQDSLGKNLEIIIDGGACQVGLESTVLSLVTDSPTILRPGGISQEEIEKLIGPVQLFKKHPTKSEEKSFASPGMLDKHYSPLTRLAFIDSLSVTNYPAKVALIRFNDLNQIPKFSYQKIITLSESNNLEEIAAKLYESIREVDKLDLDLILVDSCNSDGLGQAIMDRVTRAIHT